MLSKPQPVDMEATLHPCLLTQKVKKCVTRLQPPIHPHPHPQITRKLVSMDDHPGSQAVEILHHVCSAVILSRSLFVLTFGQRKSLKALCLSGLGSGLGLALQKVAFAFLPQMTETLKPRIVSLHPLPFTPANVFFISLGGLDFPLVLPSSSSRLPRASHNKPACLGSRRLGLLKDIPDTPLAVFFSPSPRSSGWSSGPASAVRVVSAPAHPAWEDRTFLSALPVTYCAGPGQRPSLQCLDFLISKNNNNNSIFVSCRALCLLP